MASEVSGDIGSARDDGLISRRLEAMDTCVLSDALDSLGLRGVLPGLVPMWQCRRVAGPVRTMRLRRIEPGEAPPVSRVHLGCRAIEASHPGDIIVVANQGRLDSGAWGGLLSAAATVRGVKAVIVDGASRDIEEAGQLGLPLFARAGTPVSARKRSVEDAVDGPVDVMGVTISPGDFIVADQTGVVVIAQAQVERVLARAADLAARESRMRTAILAGTPVSQVMDQRYESMTSSTANEGDGT